MKRKNGLIELFHYKELLRQLVIKDIKLKYRRSYLGYIWSILNPLLMMIVLVIVFSQLFRFDIPNFPVYLLSGQILFNFLSEATTMAVSSIVNNAPLLKKTYVPKYIFTVSKVTSSLVNLLFSLAALVLVMIFTQVSVTWRILWVPIILFEVYIFGLGISLILAATAAFFCDIQYLWGVFISIWMYLTPIIYPVSIISEEYRWWYDNFNPMYGYVKQFRDVILNGSSLPLEWLAQGFVVAFVFLFIGYWVFKRKQNKFILYI
ncbi:ABC transporter permease [Aggregatibacter actinomycetemcomitans]|uniref:Transport permease protein n=1 Tax=Aggregatibacter actinomycetemcomitans TaxID=714 RepID=Q9AQB6_AGGAC|nr:ABC transporter permease [Aggregatibacter actinomycetemcomitans]AAG49407.1 ABC transporter integral membrane subunit [Aggregatibacter actinomycetemcomitans]KOE69925.1 ABC transporter [Aggregatibacter actinomycetemcomitans serotype f str. D18P1]MBN6061152.1 ABC transporter permease [Aggregatibacter actinomycetemcomitans]MBN6069123.1 ABC transporter permease [Aggregatibacter actinomycetemcomitans]MBN6086168.1 ABC transporter permease [Aggregatibacter actinomycetemcomitans]